ncbi:MAG: presenilin family intramembrane aspartyl protease [Candidatus Aenigmatarchaeota archaeon]
MKMVVSIIAMFLVTQLLGLYIGVQYLGLIEYGELPPVFENPESFGNPFMLFMYMMVSTAGILLLIKFWKPSIRALEAFVVFFSSWLAFDFLLPISLGYVSLGLLLAIVLTVWKVFRPTILNQNIAAIISGAGVGAILGSSFGIAPSILFLVLLCTYDFIAVFVTKHMVLMAKELTKRPMAFTIASPYKFKKPTYVGIKGKKKMFHVFQLGVGDMVIPLMFSVSLLRYFPVTSSLITIAGSTIALLSLILFMKKKPIPLPAMPFIAVGTLSGFLISMLLV